MAGDKKTIDEVTSEVTSLTQSDYFTGTQSGVSFKVQAINLLKRVFGDLQIDGNIKFDGVKDIDTDTRYIHDASATEDEIFDALSPYIPNTDDMMPINGSSVDSGSFYIFSRAVRDSSSEIDLYYTYLIDGVVDGVGTLSIVNGNAGTHQISISW